LIFFKLRCRKFVELILETSEIKKRKNKILRERDDRRKDREETWIDDEMNMDIDDDDASRPLPYRPSSSKSISITSSYSTPDGEDAGELEDLEVQYETALNEAINYGQTLAKNQSDPRPELQQLFKKTFGIVAWEDPLEAGGATADIVGQNSRIALAHEVNQAILKSQGRPVQPALETVYRHTSACVTQLGLLGVGAAAFADMSREFLQA